MLNKEPYIKGDNIKWEGTLGLDITGWKVRCELYDREGVSIKLATANSGGSNDQIEITDASNGVLLIKVPKTVTENISDRAFLEVEFETADSPTEIYTGLADEVKFKCARINWETPS